MRQELWVIERFMERLLKVYRRHARRHILDPAAWEGPQAAHGTALAGYGDSPSRLAAVCGFAGGPAGCTGSWRDADDTHERG